MKLDNVFRWVWRINGLLILLGSLFIVAELLTDRLKRSGRSEAEPVVTNIADDPEGAENWALGRSEAVSGSNFVYVHLESAKSEYEAVDASAQMNMFSGGGNYRETYSKNILFVNRQTDKMHWLFDGVGQFVTSIDQRPRKSRYLPDSEDTTRFIFYSVIDKDTNGDGKVNTEDARSLAYSRYDGSGYQVVLQGYERLLSQWLDDSDQLSIIYQKSGIGYLARYSLSPFVLVSNTELPRIKDQI